MCKFYDNRKIQTKNHASVRKPETERRTASPIPIFRLLRLHRREKRAMIG